MPVIRLHTRGTKLDAVLQGPDVVSVTEFNQLQTVRLLHVLDPFIGLTLRVYHQRPPSRVPERDRKDDAGQAMTHFHAVSCHTHRLQCTLYRNALLPHVL